MAVGAAAVCGAFVPVRAIAQIGAGAERYEVTISPPKRPGSEPAVEKPAGPSSGESAPAPSIPPGGEAPNAGNSPALNGSGAAPNAGTAALVPAPAPAIPAGPPRTLQVGAFRQRKSAVSLHDALAETFQDVVVVEAQSGGEPIYRVNVGRLARGPALDDLKRRLVAAGYPIFEVLAPAAESAAN